MDPVPATPTMGTLSSVRLSTLHKELPLNMPSQLSPLPSIFSRGPVPEDRLWWGLPPSECCLSGWVLCLLTCCCQPPTAWALRYTLSLCSACKGLHSHLYPFESTQMGGVDFAYILKKYPGIYVKALTMVVPTYTSSFGTCDETPHVCCEDEIVQG